MSFPVQQTLYNEATGVVMPFASAQNLIETIVKSTFDQCNHAFCQTLESSQAEFKNAILFIESFRKEAEEKWGKRDFGTSSSDARQTSPMHGASPEFLALSDREMYEEYRRINRENEALHNENASLRDQVQALRNENKSLCNELSASRLECQDAIKGYNEASMHSIRQRESNLRSMRNAKERYEEIEDQLALKSAELRDVQAKLDDVLSTERYTREQNRENAVRRSERIRRQNGGFNFT